MLFLRRKYNFKLPTSIFRVKLLNFCITIRFAKLVNRGFNKIELILKTIMTPPDPIDGFIESYIFLIADKSLSNFQKIMELKASTTAKVSS